MINGVAKQNGAALVVGLVMLLVMTLMGVTSMNATRTELKIAINMNNHSTAFQTAALVIERALVDPLIDWTDASSTPQTGSYAAGYTSSDGLKSGSFTLTFSGCRSAAGSSLTGRGGSMIVHEIVATGTVENGAGDVLGTSRQTSGYKTVAAGCVAL